MAPTLNPSHPLVGNVVELIGVQNGALVSTRSPRSFTRHPNAGYVSGGFYGEAFRSLAAGYAVQGASFSPAVIMDTGAMTLFIVTNSLSIANGAPPYPLVSSTQGSYQPGVGLTTNGKAMAVASYSGAGGGVVSATTVSVGAHSMALTRSGDTQHELFVDGALQASGGQLGWTTASGIWDTLGGASGHASVTADLVWIVWFNRVLGAAEIASLHTGLSAGNGFTLVGGTALSGSAPIPPPVAAGGGQFLTDVMINNTGQVLAKLGVRWSWFPGGRIGALAGITPVEGAGVTDAQGQLLVTGLPAGPGLLLVAQWITHASDDKIYYIAGDVS